IIDPKAPTVLVYGHYDVMPVDPIELWKTAPFEPEIKDGKIYARGANDDKGQSFMHAKAFEFMVKEGKLPCNVKFMIEGEEEIGSPSLEAWCVEHKEMLKADIILVSDTSMIAQDTPSITVGLRGLTYVEVKVTGPNKDLHSGIFGGAVANPANVLTQMIASLIDEKGHITIPGFYDEVLDISAEERVAMAKAPFCLTEYQKALDIQSVQGEEGFSTIERTGIRPSLDINGIWSGYTGEGAKTVLPSEATAKISMRLVPNQNWEKIGELISKHLKAIAPSSVKVDVTILHGGQAYVSPMDMPAYKAAEKAYEKVFGKTPIPTRSGGSIPIVAAFERVLGIKSILMGFGLEADAIHSPNESYQLYNFYKGIETIPYFYQEFAKMAK
ncbi:MAG: dipeptidase, partial [Bacteroidales bacterium]